MIGHVAVIVDASSFEASAAHAPPASPNQNHLNVRRRSLFIDVALNQRCEPLLVDSLCNQLPAKSIIPHVPHIDRVLTCKFHLCLNAACQIDIESKEAAIADVLAYFVQNRPCLLLLILGHVLVKLYEFDRLQLVHDGAAVVNAAHLASFPDHHQIVSLVDGQYAQQAQHFGAFVIVQWLSRQTYIILEMGRVYWSLWL